MSRETDRRNAPESMDLARATQRLIELRQQQESVDMEKAAILKHVKDNGLYKEDGLTWAEYCSDRIQYHYTSVVRLLRIYDNPHTRDAYTDLGHMRALHVANYARALTAKDVSDADVDRLTRAAVNVAPTMTATKLQQRLRKSVRTVTDPDADADAPVTLGDVVDELKNLETQEKELKAELDRVRARMTTLRSVLASVPDGTSDDTPVQVPDADADADA